MGMEGTTCAPTPCSVLEKKTGVEGSGSPVKLPLREFLEAGDAPLELPLGEEPRGEPPLGERPLRGEAPLKNTSFSAGSGTEAKRAEVKTCVG